MCDYGWNGKDLNSKQHWCLIKEPDHKWEIECDHDVHDGACCAHATHATEDERR